MRGAWPATGRCQMIAPADHHYDSRHPRRVSRATVSRIERGDRARRRRAEGRIDRSVIAKRGGAEIDRRQRPLRWRDQGIVRIWRGSVEPAARTRAKQFYNPVFVRCSIALSMRPWIVSSTLRNAIFLMKVNAPISTNNLPNTSSA